MFFWCEKCEIIPLQNISPFSKSVLTDFWSLPDKFVLSILSFIEKMIELLAKVNVTEFILVVLLNSRDWRCYRWDTPPCVEPNYALETRSLISLLVHLLACLLKDLIFPRGGEPFKVIVNCWISKILTCSYLYLLVSIVLSVTFLLLQINLEHRYLWTIDSILSTLSIS